MAQEKEAKEEEGCWVYAAGQAFFGKTPKEATEKAKKYVDGL